MCYLLLRRFLIHIVYKNKTCHRLCFYVGTCHSAGCNYVSLIIHKTYCANSKKKVFVYHCEVE